MQLPDMLQGESRTRLLQGAFAGFLATTIIGFNWGGWTLGGTAAKMADDRATSAVVAALAPICAANFQKASDATTVLVELKKTDSWKQDDFVQKGGWATLPGMASPDRKVADACAKLLNGAK